MTHSRYIIERLCHLIFWRQQRLRKMRETKCPSLFIAAERHELRRLLRQLAGMEGADITDATRDPAT